MAEGNIAKGAGSGALKGAALGANPALLAATGGLSAPIGAAAGAIFGGVKSGVAEKKKKAAQGLLPGQEDPTQTSRQIEIDRIAKNVQAGSDPATQQAIQAGQETVANTQSRLSRVTGGSGGATVDALIKSQRAGGQVANQAIAQGQQRLPFFMNLGQQIANRAEQRKLELQLLERAQFSAEGAQSQKETNVNTNAVLASGIGADEIGQVAGGSSDRIKSLLNNINLNGSPEEIQSPGVQNIPTSEGILNPPPIGDVVGGAPTTGAGAPFDPSALAGIFGG